MENKSQQTVLPDTASASAPVTGSTVIDAIPDEALPGSNELSLEPGAGYGLKSPLRQPYSSSRILRFVKRADVLLVLVFVLASISVFFLSSHHKANNPAQAYLSSASNFNTVKIPLSGLTFSQIPAADNNASVTINGPLVLNDSLQLTPSLQPTGAKPGEIYFDSASDQLAYYNGQNFVFLSSTGPTGLQSLGGATGQVALGGGLGLSSGTLSNTGVLSVQGLNGAVTFNAGPGLVLNGTTFANSGVLSVSSGSPNVSVASNGNGNVSISVAAPVAGTGTVTSSGGSAGSIPVFTGSQNIEDSIITQSGLGVNIAGSLDLGSALTVVNGGTGAASLSNDGILVGQGSSPVSSVVASSAGLCLLSTSGLPTWGTCPVPTGGSVNSLNGLSGTLTIANASGTGSTITINAATTSSEGIASFSGSNFSVTGGAVDTIQDINTGATPTFAGLDTNIITPSGAMTVGATGQALTLQGSSATALTATNGANTTTLAFGTPTANVTYRLQSATAGTYDICTTAGNCSTVNSVTSPGGTVDTLAKFTGSQIIGDSLITDDGTTVGIGGALTVSGNTVFTGTIAVNGGSISANSALSIAPSGSLTLGSSGKQLILQGNSSSTLSATSGADTTSFTFQTPAANVTYVLPTATAGSYSICTTVGNCAGTGGGVTTPGGTTNYLPKFGSAQTLENSTISDNGTNVTISVNLLSKVVM